MGEFESLLGRNGLLPHGYCFQWSPGLLWSMVGADAVIAMAYFSIPLAIVSFVRQRPVGELGLVPVLFVAFILACGLTHVFGIWTIWRPEYELQTAVKLMTAAVSAATAVALWRLMPRALAIPTVAELRAALGALQAEVDRRRSAEETLAEVEQALAAALAASGAAFVATDRDGRITRMNVIAEAVTGWTQAEAAGRPLPEVLQPEPADDGAGPAAAAGAAGVAGDGAGGPLAALRNAAVPVAMVVRARDGTRKPIELSAQPARQGGELSGLNLIFRDMSQLTRAEADLRRLAAVVDSSTDAVITKSLDGTITSVNAAAERLFGWPAAEIVGEPSQRLIPPEREAEETRMLADLGRGVVRPPFDTSRLTRDGRRIEVSVSLSPIRDALGHIVGGAVVARDLTHQRRIETALARNEQRLRFALDAARLGAWQMDIDGATLHGSLQFFRCFGVDDPPARWGLADLAAAVHPDDRAGVLEPLRSALARRAEWHAEFRVRWPDGSEHWVRLDGRVRDDGDRAPLMAGVARDTTAVRDAERAREAAERLARENRQIQEASRLKSEFLANMSHELRTPLNAVIGFADLLRAGAVPVGSERHAEYLGHIAASGRHLLQIINDVLDLSKVEAGKLVLEPVAVDPQRLVDEVVGALGTQAAAKRLSLQAHVAPGLHDLVLDAARLRQVMFNFLSNAIKFTPDGGHVHLRLAPEGPLHFRLEVEDDGIGIDPAQQPLLFVEFQQLDTGYDKRHQGTGLGLALTRRLVQAQGGRVGLASEPGRGSVFHAVLPRRPGSGAGDAPRVLVAHEAPAHRDTLARGLSGAGIVADTAGTVAEVLAFARTTRYDAMTLDLRMPDGSTLRALGDLEATTPAARGPVRAIAMRAPGGAVAAFAVADVLGKPLAHGDVPRAMAHLRPGGAAGTAGTAGAAGGRGPVLVIDDDPLACEVMLAALAAAGLEGVAVHGGHEALERLPSIDPSAIVLDLMMPGLDGFQLLDRLRADPAGRELPVFVWTALDLGEAEFARLAESAERIAAKGGATPSDLVDAVVAGMRRQRRQEAG